MTTASAIQTHQRLFTDRYIEKKVPPINLLSIPDFDKKLGIIKAWQEGIHHQRIIKAKEEQLQSDFLNYFFGEILGYAYSQSLPRWNLEKEHKSALNSTKSDGALGFFEMVNGKPKGDVRVVIELKDARTDLDKPQNRLNDRRTPVQQAFDYANSSGGNCRWVIVSNFIEIRLYHHTDRTRYEHFEIIRLTEDAELKRFLTLLQRSNLIQESGDALVDKLFQDRQLQEAEISKQFYSDYKKARVDLFHHLREQNPTIDPLVILSKTQKLLDRVTFVWFCEDFQLIPAFTLRTMLQAVKEDRFNRSETKIYDRIRGLFDAIDHGLPEENINKFNGGLFAEDPMLDSLHVKDSTLEHIIELEKYDFASDLNVNILGHIFEQSISDIEELRASITQEAYDEKKGKRKKDGVFYTPEYITRYIVGQAVGGWLEDRKREMGFDSLPELTHDDYDSIKMDKKLQSNKAIQQHITAWEAYRKRLRQIRVLDPACGSGAFLNQVFDYLYREGQKVNEELTRLKLGQSEIFDLDKHILSNNIFGVDLNPESVDITKLSLWLKTANRDKELTSLDEHILCGNSLIDDPAYAGERAFDWSGAFQGDSPSYGESPTDFTFDVVVGNPPYVRQELFSAQKPYLEQHYEVYTGVADLYVYFFERGLKLLAPNGQFAFIVSNKFLRAGYGKKLIKYLQCKYTLQEIIDFGDLQIFEGATTYPCIISIKQQQPSEVQQVSCLQLENLDKVTELKEEVQQKGYLAQIKADDETWQLGNPEMSSLLEKIKTCSVPLGEFVNGRLYYGIKTGLNEAFVIDAAIREQLITEDPKSAEVIKPFLAGRDINRYEQPNIEQYLIYAPWNFDLNLYPAINRHLTQWQTELSNRPECLQGRFNWWCLSRYASDYYQEFEKHKIVVPAIVQNASYAYDKNACYSNDKTSIVITDNLYVLTILNSKVADYFIHSVASTKQGGFYEYKPMYVSKIPIPMATNDQQASLAKQAEKMLALTTDLQTSLKQSLEFIQAEYTIPKLTQKLEKFYTLEWKDFVKELEKQKIKLDIEQKEELMGWFKSKQAKFQQLQAEISQLDRAIDQAVYGLYGLTEDEIKLVESQS